MKHFFRLLLIILLFLVLTSPLVLIHFLSQYHNVLIIILSINLMIFLIGIFLGINLSNKKFSQNHFHLFDSAVISSINGIFFTDMKGHLTFVNPSFLKLWGYKSEKEVLGRHLSDFYPYEERKKAMEIIKALDETGKWSGEINALKKDNSRFTSQTSANVVYDKNSTPIFLMSSAIDITKQKQSEKNLKKLEMKLQFEKKKLEQVLNIDQKISSTLQINHLVDFIVEKASQILDAEKCSLMLLDEETNELLIKGSIGIDNNIIKKSRVKVGKSISGFVAKTKNPILVKDIDKNKSFMRKNYAQYKSNSFMSVPIIIHNKLVGVVNVTDKKSNYNIEDSDVFNEIDLKILCTIVRRAALSIENANYYQRLEFLSTIDPITGIHNHRFFIQALDNEIERLKRYHRSLSLLMIDINNFKSYNDDYGHLEGDILLKKIAEIIQSHIRSIDIVCRYAGDEFVLILPETDITNAELVAKKILYSVENLNLNRKITLSIGITIYAKERDRRDLVMKADKALMQAKKNPINKISCIC